MRHPAFCQDGSACSATNKRACGPPFRALYFKQNTLISAVADPLGKVPRQLQWPSSSSCRPARLDHATITITLDHYGLHPLGDRLRSYRVLRGELRYVEVRRARAIPIRSGTPSSSVRRNCPCGRCRSCRTRRGTEKRSEQNSERAGDVKTTSGCCHSRSDTPRSRNPQGAASLAVGTAMGTELTLMTPQSAA
jgi:hypothetical protein